MKNNPKQKAVKRTTKKATKGRASFLAFDNTTLVLSRDVTLAILIVSLLINLTVFITWLVLQVTSRYDSQVAQLLFN